MVDINGLRCYNHTELDCCETGDNPSLKNFTFHDFSNWMLLVYSLSFTQATALVKEEHLLRSHYIYRVD